jgi:SHS2 domain-containing protein
MTRFKAGERGHRRLPHTADTRIEAWAPTRETCLAEAVRGLVASFVEIAGARPMRTATVDLTADSDADTLVQLLDEVIYLLDTQGEVPIGTEVVPGPDGPAMRLHLAPVADTRPIGAVPKAVTLHDLRFGRTDGGWSCTVTIDV